MSSESATLAAAGPALCRGRAEELRGWLEQGESRRIRLCIALILAGGALYGFSLGVWRSPLMGVYVAVKLPLLVGLTLAVNGLLNGMLAQILGSGLSFRQTMLAILMSFATFCFIAGSLSPLAAFLALNAPAPDEPGGAQTHSTLLLMHTAIIAFAGITANARLFPLLRQTTGNAQTARRVFIAWLAGNLIVGAQLSWVLRPFFGRPGRPVEFIRPDWAASNFYENVWHHLSSLVPDDLESAAAAAFLILAAAVITFIILLLRAGRQRPLLRP